MEKMSLRVIKKLWVERIVKNGKKLDRQNDKEGHDWHSLWTGFVVALGRPDLTSWIQYMRHGFPLEATTEPYYDD